MKMPHPDLKVLPITAIIASAAITTAVIYKMPHQQPTVHIKNTDSSTSTQPTDVPNPGTVTTDTSPSTPTSSAPITITPTPATTTPSTPTQSPSSTVAPAPTQNAAPTTNSTAPAPAPIITSSSLEYRNNADTNMQDGYCTLNYSDGTSATKYIGSRPGPGIGRITYDLQC